MATKGSCLDLMFFSLPYTRFRSAIVYLMLKPLKEWDLSSLRPLPTIPVKDSPGTEAAEGVRPEQPATPPLYPGEGLGGHGTESTAQNLDVSRSIVVQHILIAFITTSRWNNHFHLRVASWYNFLKTFWKTSVIFVGLVLDFSWFLPYVLQLCRWHGMDSGH